MAVAELKLLGVFELRLSDGEAVELPGQKDRALLAILALAQGAPQSRDRLAGLLWSDRGDPQARDSLKHALTRVRQSLGAALSDALIAHYLKDSDKALDAYEAKALARVWKAERFSWFLTKLMHRFPDDGPFEHRMQSAELDYVAASDAMRIAIAENYVGLPL